MLKFNKNNTLNLGLSSLVAIISIFTVVNFFSGIVAGVWLLIIGSWPYIVFGIIISFLMPYAFTIASLPLLPLYALLVKLAEKKQKFFTLVLALVCSSLTNIILLFWVVYVFSFIGSNSTEKNYIPMLIWGYAVTLGPLGYMASKEPDDSTGTTLGVWFAMIAYIVLTVTTIFFGYDLSPIIILLIIFSITPVIILSSTFNKYQDEVTETLVCPECGKPSKPTNRFCKFCGNAIVSN